MNNENNKLHIIADVLASMVKDTIFEGNVYLVGGCVRDYIMGKNAKDYDVCVTLPQGGIDLADFLHLHHKNNVKDVVLYKTYVTANISLKLPNGDWEQIDLVETRKERYSNVESRNPTCVYGSISDDCFRRDLTINSLYYNISTKEILDLTGRGESDIEKGILITPCDPDITFFDDPLRILRVIRFASRFKMDIDEGTLRAMHTNAHRLKVISKERIQSEFNGILTSSNPIYGLQLIREIGALECAVFPEIAMLYDMEQNKYHFGTVWEHTLKVVSETPPILECRMGALLHDLGKLYTKTVSDEGDVKFIGHEVAAIKLIESRLRKLKYSNDFIADVTKLVSNHMRLKFAGDTADVKKKTLRKLMVDMCTTEMLDNLLHVIHADNVSHATEYCLPNQIGLIRGMINELSLAPTTDNTNKIVLPVTGNDIMNLLGIGPSPYIKEIKDMLNDAYLEDPTISKSECIKLILNYDKNK
ncbi:MAG: CCA tRNA nucleotidyltransferase [Bacteroidales bacterium]